MKWAFSMLNIMSSSHYTACEWGMTEYLRHSQSIYLRSPQGCEWIPGSLAHLPRHRCRYRWWSTETRTVCRALYIVCGPRMNTKWIIKAQTILLSSCTALYLEYACIQLQFLSSKLFRAYLEFLLVTILLFKLKYRPNEEDWYKTFCLSLIQ